MSIDSASLRQRYNLWPSYGISVAKILRLGNSSSGEKRVLSAILSQVIVRAGSRTHLSRAATNQCKHPTMHNTTEIFAVKRQRDVQIMDLIIRSCIQRDKALISLV